MKSEKLSRGLKAEIAKRAYKIWEAEGRVHGHDLAHWFQAENEIFEKPIRSDSAIRNKSLNISPQGSLRSGAVPTAQAFDENRYVCTGRLFDQAVEDDRRVAYHGTSLFFSQNIESRGLAPNFELVAFDLVLKIASGLPPEESTLADSLKEYATIGGTRLSFSPVSHRAFRYGYTFGGQISSQLRRAARYGIVPEKVLDLLTSLNKQGPCVYAVDLNDIPDEFITAEASGSIYVSTTVCPECLTHRMELPVKAPSFLDNRPANAPTAEQLLRRPETLFSRLYRACPKSGVF